MASGCAGVRLEVIRSGCGVLYFISILIPCRYSRSEEAVRVSICFATMS